MSRLIAKADEVVSRMGRAAAEMVLGTEQQQPQQNVYYHAHYYPSLQPYYHPQQPPPGPVYAQPPLPSIPQPYQQPAYQYTASPHPAHGPQQYYPPPITPQHSGTHYTPHVPTDAVPTTYPPPPPQQQRPSTVHANSWPNPQPNSVPQHAPVAPSTPVSNHDFHARPTSIYMPSAATPPSNASWTKPPITDAGPVTEPESSAQPPPAYDSIKFEKPVTPALPQRHKSQSNVNALLSPENDRPNLPPRRKHAQSVSVVPPSGPAGQQPGLTPIPATAIKPEPLGEKVNVEPSAKPSHPIVPDDMLRPILPLRSSRSQSLSGHAHVSTPPVLPVRSDTNPFRVSSHATGPAAPSSSTPATGVNRLTVPTPEEFVASLETEPILRPSTEPLTIVAFPPNSIPEVPIATKPPAVAATNLSEPMVAQPMHPSVPTGTTTTRLNIPMPEQFAASVRTEAKASVSGASLPYPDHHDQTTHMPMSPDDDTHTNIGLFMRRPVSALYESHEVMTSHPTGNLRQRPVSAIYSAHEDHLTTTLAGSNSRMNTLHPSVSIIAPLNIRKPSLPSAPSAQSPSTITTLPAQLTTNPDVRKQPSNPTLSSPPDHVFELNGEPTSSSRPEINAAIHEICPAAGTEPQPGKLQKQGTIPIEWESHGGFSLGFDIGAGKRG